MRPRYSWTLWYFLEGERKEAVIQLYLDFFHFVNEERLQTLRENMNQTRHDEPGQFSWEYDEMNDKEDFVCAYDRINCEIWESLYG